MVRERGGMVRSELWGVADSEQLLHHIEGTVTSLHRCYHFVFLNVSHCNVSDPAV